MSAGGTIPEWIQAVCSVFALAGLIWYTAETRRIRLATINQMRAAQRPFLSAKVCDTLPGKLSMVENRGDGPALSIYWKKGTENGDGPEGEMWFFMGTLAKGQSSLFNRRPDRALLEVLSGDGVRVHYCDMAGNWYWHWAQIEELATSESYVEEDNGDLPGHSAFPKADRQVIRSQFAVAIKELLAVFTR
jgi:hypothetical protein